MTPVALVAAALLVPMALALVASAVSRRRRGQTVGRWRSAGAVGSVLFVAVVSSAVAGWAAPDALDRLPVAERRGVGPALDASPECGLLPFARVLAVEVGQPSDRPPTLRYTCGITHLGFPRFSGEATCADGTWFAPGLVDFWHGGSCQQPGAPRSSGDPAGPSPVPGPKGDDPGEALGAAGPTAVDVGGR